MDHCIALRVLPARRAMTMMMIWLMAMAMAMALWHYGDGFSDDGDDR